MSLTAPPITEILRGFEQFLNGFHNPTLNMRLYHILYDVGEWIVLPILNRAIPVTSLALEKAKNGSVERDNLNWRGNWQLWVIYNEN